jgi:hypothetical protein
MSIDHPSVRLSFGKQVGIELRRLVHPSYVQPLLVGRQVIEDRTPEVVWAFFGL